MVLASKAMCETDWSSVRMPDGPSRENLIIVRTGNKSVHRDWVKNLADGDRNWDLLISHWGSDEPYTDGADIVVRQGGYKYGAVARLLKDIPWLSSYRAVCLCDDDIMMSWADIQRMFDLFLQFDLDLAQPSLTPESSINHRIFAHRDEYILRYTDFVEVMVPIFSPRALQICAPTFEDTKYGNELDYVWPQLLGRPINKMAVLDDVSVTHARPTGTSDLYVEMKDDHFDLMTELKRLLTKYKISGVSQLEFGYILKKPHEARSGAQLSLRDQQQQLDGRLLPLLLAAISAPIPSAWRNRSPVWNQPETWEGGPSNLYKIPQMATSDWCMTVSFDVCIETAISSGEVKIFAIGNEAGAERFKIVCVSPTADSVQFLLATLGKGRREIMLLLPPMALGVSRHFCLQVFPMAGWTRFWCDGTPLPDVWSETLEWCEADCVLVGNEHVSGKISNVWVSPMPLEEQAQSA